MEIMWLYQMVMLKHLYGHCNSILVTKGQPVSIGDKIALTGSTGASTGSHLHLEYKKKWQIFKP